MRARDVRGLAAIALAALVVAGLACTRDARAGEPGSELTIAVLTMGPGDHPFYKFGHDAILVRDAKRGRDDVYNFGTFDYRSPTLITDFLKGRLAYWLSVQSLAATLAQYRAQNRTITEQDLALTPAQRRALSERLAWNALPENRAYRYDYYRDNCATRLRDAIDAVIDGRLRAASNAPASLTLRGHTERLTADDVPVYLGLDVAMGDAVDAPITQWEEMFLPSKVQERLRYATLTTPAGDVALVARESLLLDARRPPLRDAPPRWGLRMGLVGATLGVLLGALGFGAQRSRGLRVAFGGLLAALGLGAGLLGCVFLFFWVATDHAVAHHNENVFQCSPLGLALAVFGVGFGWGSEGCGRAVAMITSALALTSIAGVLVKVLPWFDQGNGPLLAFFVPVWVGAALGARPALLPFTRRFTRPWLRPGAPPRAEE